jgi:N-ethylmaleimide reductase
VLFEPLPVGELTLPNRILMAPLTRSRAGQPGDVPQAMNGIYYAQRASAGLIISEATQVSEQGRGYAFTPGIHTEEQVEGWKGVTRAVHDAGGLIFCQLWHVGRISHTDLQPGGGAPIAPSALRASSQTYTHRSEGMVPVSEPRALKTEEIPGIIQQFVHGAKCAEAAGFDGVELHGANGYLLDQFTRDGTNKRDDEYGGSVENRCRLPLMVAEAVAGVWGAGRVGYRVSPTGSFNDMSDSDPIGTFSYLASGLGALGLGYIHVAEAFAGSPRDEAAMDAVRRAFGGVYIANGAYDVDSAADRIRRGGADAIAFGELFLANPDLPERIKRGGPFNEPDRSTFYGGTEKGYTDYPTLAEV